MDVLFLSRLDLYLASLVYVWSKFTWQQIRQENWLRICVCIFSGLHSYILLHCLYCWLVQYWDINLSNKAFLIQSMKCLSEGDASCNEIFSSLKQFLFKCKIGPPGKNKKKSKHFNHSKTQAYNTYPNLYKAHFESVIWSRVEIFISFLDGIQLLFIIVPWATSTNSIDSTVFN